LLREQPWPHWVAITYEAVTGDGLRSAPALAGFFLRTGEEPLDARLAIPPCTLGRTCSSAEPVTLDGSASTQAARGESFRYCWTQTRGPDLGTGGAGLAPGLEVCSASAADLVKTLQLPPPIVGEPAPRSYAFLLQVEKRQPGNASVVLGRSAP